MPAIGELATLVPLDARIDLAYPWVTSLPVLGTVQSIRTLVANAGYYEIPRRFEFSFFAANAGNPRLVTLSLADQDNNTVLQFGAATSQPIGTTSFYLFDVDVQSAYALSATGTNTMVHTPLPLFAMLSNYLLYIGIQNWQAGDAIAGSSVVMSSIRVPTGPQITTQPNQVITPVLV